MVNSCCAFGCTNRFIKDNNIRFYRFPKDPVRKKLWILALRRKDFEPSASTRICSDHFQTGKPSMNSYHPDYVPSVFTFSPLKKTKQINAKIKRSETPDNTATNNSETIMDINIESYVTSEFTGIEDQMFKLRAQLPGLTKMNAVEHEKVSEEEDELLNLKLELHEAFTDISSLRKENDSLVKKLSTADTTQSLLHKTISEKEEELLKVKKEVQQAYTEISALRIEKEELQKKLMVADVVQGILQDSNKLHFYTGLNSMKDFNSILSLLSDVESSVRSVPLETQVLIVLTKLKLNLLYTDLAYRFQTSSKTVHRICDIIIPPLEAKIDLLVKCPINTALKKNIPVCFKNTVYENLYQRLLRHSKSKTKQFNDEEEDSDFGIL